VAGSPTVADPEIRAIRDAIRASRWTAPTAEVGSGRLQANLVVLPQDAALGFVTFCRNNPRACPLLELTEPGNPRLRLLAAEADIRTDLPRYDVYRHGLLIDSPTSILDVWRDDLVAFLIGCSFTFEQGLLDAGIHMKHVAAGCNVAMYRTTIGCRPASGFKTNLVVSMRPIKRERLADVFAICSHYPLAHGQPLGADALKLGIDNLSQPDFGDFVDLADDEVPVFWACGVTASMAAVSAELDLTITHAPGHMFITDWSHVEARDAGNLLGDPLQDDRKSADEP
jgi:uncharacterized protein YcsI (UPF0317 family)